MLVRPLAFLVVFGLSSVESQRKRKRRLCTVPLPLCSGGVDLHPYSDSVASRECAVFKNDGKPEELEHQPVCPPKVPPATSLSTPMASNPEKQKNSSGLYVGNAKRPSSGSYTARTCSDKDFFSTTFDRYGANGHVRKRRGCSNRNVSTLGTRASEPFLFRYTDIWNLNVLTGSSDWVEPVKSQDTCQCGERRLLTGQDNQPNRPVPDKSGWKKNWEGGEAGNEGRVLWKDGQVEVSMKAEYDHPKGAQALCSDTREDLYGCADQPD